MKRLSRDIWVPVCYNETRKKKEGSGDMQNMQDMKRKRTAVVAGHICLDITPVFHNSAKEINQILMPGKIVNVDAAEIHSGGAVANTGLAMQFFDIDTKLMGKIGTDTMGQTLLSCLARYGGSDGMQIDTNVTTSYSVVLAIPGIDRVFLHHAGANDTFGIKDIDFSIVEKSDLFHFGYPSIMRQLYLHDGKELKEIFQKIYHMGVITSLDMAAIDATSEAAKQDWKKILANVLPYVDFFVPSIEEICFMIDPKRYENWVERAGNQEITAILDVEKDISPIAQMLQEMGANHILLKCGAPGLYYHIGNPKQIQRLEQKLEQPMSDWIGQKGFQKSYSPKRVLSATGAGDTTIAAFLSAMLQGYDFKWCIRLAAATGAVCVEQYDALGGLCPLPVLKQEIENGWENRK